ncbi:transposase [Rhodococcus opacus]|uniref:IS110 family transposase n=1 Tax=Rhodococcus opacus TaxID=37919 RepID=UPI00294A3254|nr:transposase [Rhodococcus opacus]MDV6244907.1 transposase [Rhodococcus opacus]
MAGTGRPTRCRRLVPRCTSRIHLSVKGFRYRRVKNDVRDARDLADLLRMHRLPEAWIAPPATRELRELVRYRAKLVALRTGLKARCTRCSPRPGC